MAAKGVEHQVDQLIQSRYHGAINIAGIKFQIAYSVLRAFDLFQPNAPTSIKLEGIEDVDIKGRREINLRGVRIVDQYVQVKTSKRAWDWGRFAGSKILDNFLPFWSADPTAELLVVTNFGYDGNLRELVKFCNGERNTLSRQLRTNLLSLCQRAGYPNADPLKILKQITFERIPDDELSRRVTRAIVQAFNLNSPNTDIYFLVLMAKFLNLAAQRGEVGRRDLEAIRLFIQEQIEVGVKNPAIQNGWIERLKFIEEEHPEDYYEGKNARPGHILAGLDVQRPAWAEHIHKVLQRSRVCVVRTASGQGKSTLLYRYAYEHYQPETTFVVKNLSEEHMVGAVKQAVTTRQWLGLPILILLDNVRAHLRFWHKLAAEFAGQDVYFLITVREEDWHRYSGSASGFVWEVVTPTLSLEEARKIFMEFQRKNKIAAGMKSAEWAFEQVAERKLLIEFTYLITHGQMLADRLAEQAQEMQRMGEDKAKLQVLRLISVAQSYESRVSVKAVLHHVHFAQDPGLTLQSLEREYILCADGICEGLHYVRSQHLTELLHKVIPVEETMIELIRILDADNLESFVSTAFSDPEVDHSLLLEALVKRCQAEPLDIVNRVIKALFTASEMVYFRAHKHLFDMAVEELGTSAVFMLSASTMPFLHVNLLNDMKGIFGEDHPNLTLFSNLMKQFAPRQWSERNEVHLLRRMAEHVDREYLKANFLHLGEFFGWCQLADVDLTRLIKFLSEEEWLREVYHADLIPAANILEAIYKYDRESYEHLLSSNKTSLISYFKLVSDTILVEERGEDIYIEFIVEESDAHPRPVDQASDRLSSLRKFFPQYQRYCSQGLYVTGQGLKRAFDDTHKELSNDTLNLSVDAERNSAYLRTVESQYAAQSAYEWQKQWFELRRNLLDFIGKVIRVFENTVRSKPVNSDPVNAIWRDVMLRVQRLRKLPSPLRERLSNEQKTVDDWASSISNFLRQVTETEENSRRLMRYNLKEANQKLPSFQQALQKVITETQPYFDHTAFNAEEIDLYPYLAEALDLLFDKNEQIKELSLRQAVENRRHLQKTQFADAVRSALSPLEEQGFTFMYPSGPLSEDQLIAISLGFEVLDFQQAALQMELIIMRFASFPHEYNFLYLVPLLNGYRYESEVWRISSQHVQELAQGTLAETELALLPVKPPQGLFTLLPEIQQRSLPELSLVSDFYRMYNGFNSIRETMYFVKDRLDTNQPFELQLIEKYQNDLQLAAAKISGENVVWTEQVLQFAQGNPAEAEWRELCQICFQKLETISSSINPDPDTYQSIDPLEDMKPQIFLLNQYLNARYLS